MNSTLKTSFVFLGAVLAGFLLARLAFALGSNNPTCNVPTCAPEGSQYYYTCTSTNGGMNTIPTSIYQTANCTGAYETVNSLPFTDPTNAQQNTLPANMTGYYYCAKTKCPSGETCSSGSCVCTSGLTCPNQGCCANNRDNYCDAAGNCAYCANTACGGTCCSSGQECVDNGGNYSCCTPTGQCANGTLSGGNLCSGTDGCMACTGSCPPPETCGGIPNAPGVCGVVITPNYSGNYCDANAVPYACCWDRSKNSWDAQCIGFNSTNDPVVIPETAALICFRNNLDYMYTYNVSTNLTCTANKCIYGQGTFVSPAQDQGAIPDSTFELPSNLKFNYNPNGNGNSGAFPISYVGCSNGPCTPLSQQQACGAHDCGTASDNCGNLYICGQCEIGFHCVSGFCRS